MGTRNYNHRLVKVHRTYTVEEMASLLVVHKNTVRQWLDQGLATIDRRRPILVHGTALIAFLKQRRSSAKSPCQPGQIYCLRCRAPKTPLGSVVEYRPFTFDRGNLQGTCPHCQARLCRRVSLARMASAIGDLRVTFPLAQEHIDDSSHPSLNCDFNEDAQNHA